MKHLGMQCALDPYITVPGEIDIPLPPARNELEDAAHRCVLANALVCQWKGADAVHYSRNKNYYANPPSWTPKWFSQRKIVRAIDDFRSVGLLEGKRTRPSPNAIYRSSFWGTPKLLGRFHDATVYDLAEVARPPIELRERESDKPIDVRALSAEQQQDLAMMTDDVIAQNVIIAASSIELRRGSFPRCARGFIGALPGTVNPRKCQLRRLFRDNLDYGGRWYGPWWQNIPSRARKALMIDGKQTVEIDFSACQIRLAYGVCGLRDPMDGQVDNRERKNELYDIPGVDRGAAKSAALIMLNARNRTAAARALAEWLSEQNAQLAENTVYKEALRIIDAVVGHFAELTPVWFSDLGLRLQRIDGDICARVQGAFRKRGILVLSVHDSFIIAQQHEEKLRSAMSEAFTEGMRDADKLCSPSPGAS